LDLCVVLLRFLAVSTSYFPRLRYVRPAYTIMAAAALAKGIFGTSVGQQAAGGDSSQGASANGTVAAKFGLTSFANANPKCKECTKVVYRQELVTYDAQTWHKNCFRCANCK